MVCPNCHRLQPQGAIECTACGVIFAKFRARPGRIKRLELEVPKHGRSMVVAGILIAVALGWSWFNPGTITGPRISLTPGGELVPTTLAPGETPEQALARHLRAVDAETVERVELVMEHDKIEEHRQGVDQVRVLAIFYTGDESVSSTGRLDYTWRRGDERPTTSHSNIQATTFRRGKLETVGRDVIYRQVLRIDAPAEDWAGQTIEVELTFDERRSASATLSLVP